MADDYSGRAWELPADFPEKPGDAGFNRQWIPIQTTAFSGWVCLPLELSAQQLQTFLEKRATFDGDGTPLEHWQSVQHFILNARIDGLEPAMWQDETGLAMPGAELMNAITLEALRLGVRAQKLGNCLAPFSGILKPGTAQPQPDTPRQKKAG